MRFDVTFLQLFHFPPTVRYSACTEKKKSVKKKTKLRVFHSWHQIRRRCEISQRANFFNQCFSPWLITLKKQNKNWLSFCFFSFHFHDRSSAEVNFSFLHLCRLQDISRFFHPGFRLFLGRSQAHPTSYSNSFIGLRHNCALCNAIYPHFMCNYSFFLKINRDMFWKNLTKSVWIRVEMSSKWKKSY